MLHIIAVCLTLFPGFGAGYLLLGRFREFFPTFLVSVLIVAVVAIVEILRPIDIPVREGLGIVPLLVWNVFHAHRLWLRGSNENLDEEVERERSPFKLPPLVIIGVFALAVVLGVLSIPSLFPEDQPENRYYQPHDPFRNEAEEVKLRRMEVKAKLDKHDFSYKTGSTTRGFDHISYSFNVEPGGYTLMVYAVTGTNFSVVRSLAERISSYSDNMVYASGFEVYELKTRDRNAMLRLVADLSEHQPRDCRDGEDIGVCGYETQ